MSTGSAMVAGAELYGPVGGTWSAAGTLSEARLNHTATLLQNGKVLVAGGCADNLCATMAGASEIYDPATNTWSTVGSLNTPRDGHTATLLNTGKVLVVGGSTGFSTSTCELYDPASGTWSYAPSTSVPRVAHATAPLSSGKVLVTGGNCGRCAYATAEVYDPTADSWTATGNMTTGRFAHTATALTDGTVLVAAGAAFTGCGRNPCYFAISSAEIYDPATGEFKATGSLTTARMSHTASLLKSGKVLAEGGTGYYGALGSAESYEPLTLTISDSSLNFGFERLGVSSPPQTVTVTDVSGHPVTFGATSVSGDYGAVNTCTGTLNPGKFCTITITFTPKAAGTWAGKVTLRDNSPGNPAQTIALTGVGEANAISFSPGVLKFPGQKVGTGSAPASVLLINDGTAAVNITAIAISPVNSIFTQTNNCPATLNVNESCTLQVVFRPPDVFKYAATLSATDSAAGSPQTLAITGKGLDF